jgi:hypothetical protein
MVSEPCGQIGKMGETKLTVFPNVYHTVHIEAGGSMSARVKLCEYAAPDSFVRYCAHLVREAVLMASIPLSRDRNSAC